jgi:hypothetical protein
MWFTRTSVLILAVALVLVPAVGRARQRIDPSNARPRLSAPYRSVDVRPAPILIAPDTSAAGRADVDDSRTSQHVELADNPALPAAPDLSDRGSLRGPPRR